MPWAEDGVELAYPTILLLLLVYVVMFKHFYFALDIWGNWQTYFSYSATYGIPLDNKAELQAQAENIKKIQMQLCVE